MNGLNGWSILGKKGGLASKGSRFPEPDRELLKPPVAVLEIGVDVIGDSPGVVGLFLLDFLCLDADPDSGAANKAKQRRQQEPLGHKSVNYSGKRFESH